VSDAVEWLAIALLLLVGFLNLRALGRPGPFAAQGWRQWLAPRSLREVSHPAGIVAVGVVFGLVFDTASQAAAWGAAAAVQNGVAGAIAVSAAFAAGMMLTDTVDSQIVSRLMGGSGKRSRVVTYRRAIGFVIVALSFGMAAYGLATKLGWIDDLPDILVLMLGLGMCMCLGAIALIVRVASPRRSEACPGLGDQIT
jgi:high-affinity nickel-transport protein